MNASDPITSFTEGDPTYLFGTFSAYPFCMMLGMLAAILTICIFWKKERFQWDILLTLIIITIPSAIVGARLFFIIESAFNGDKEALSQWYAIWKGGLSIQGGVIVSATCDLIYLRFKRRVIDVRKVFGIILPTVLIGQAIGRWGNYANHELYGAETSYESIAWLGEAITINMKINGYYRIPLFLIESVTSLVGYILIVWVILNLGWTKPGTTGGIYALWYGIVRVIMEPMRTSQDFEYWYLVLAIIWIVLGLILIAYFEITGKKIYDKYKVGKFSYIYVHKMIEYIPANVNTRWINK